MEFDELKNVVVEALEDKKARNIHVLDVRKLTSMTDAMIVATGDSSRQVKALASNVQEKAKEAGAAVMGIEGEETGDWVLVDLGDIIVHLMQPAVREYYNLEALWDSQPQKKAGTPY